MWRIHSSVRCSFAGRRFRFETRVTITKARRVPVRWNGEQKLALDNNGASYNVILRDQFAQAMRTLCNEVEGDLAALHVFASRAYLFLKKRINPT